MQFKQRIGRFFTTIGFLGIIIFLLSDFAQDPRYGLVFAAITLFGEGIFISKRGQPPRDDPGRWRIIREMRAKKADNAQKKEEKKG